MHVTMSLANEPGKLDQYLAIPGLTALELDVKDETGKVGFLMPATHARAEGRRVAAVLQGRGRRRPRHAPRAST